MQKLKNVFILFLCTVIIIITGFLAYMGAGKNQALSLNTIKLGLDLAGGVSITYQAQGDTQPSSEEMKGALAVIQRRLDEKGYTEAQAYLDGTNRIRVEIPGVEDANEAVKEIGKTAMLSFVGVDWSSVVSNGLLDKYVEQYVKDGMAQKEENSSLTYTEEDLRKEAEAYLPKYMEAAISMYPEIIEDAKKAGCAEELVTGVNVTNATYQKGQISSTSSVQSYVKVEFDSEGTKLFAEGTKKYINKYIAIMLDDSLCGIPQVQAEINDGTTIITGLSEEEAKTLADDIVGGALPVQLVDIEHNSVGATLGMNALQTSIYAALIGFAIIIIFMIAVYRLPGLVASVALFFYAAMEIVLLSALKITLTLPGIAGFILSIGMAVDANVIIFSRIAEEVRQGRTLRLAVRDGFKKAVSAIVDGNVTTLIAAVVLWLFGSGTIRGFAQTLAIGIVLSMFTALVVTRILLQQIVELGAQNKALFCSTKEKKKKAGYPVIERTRVWFLVSGVLILVGVVSFCIRGFNFDIEFAGGTMIQIDMKQELDDTKELEEIVKQISGDTNPQVQPVAGTNAETQMSIKVKEISPEKIDELYLTVAEKYGLDTSDKKEDLITHSSISPTISSEMKQTAIVSTLIAAVLMLLYITIRFRDICFGLGAIVPLIHDVLIVLTVYTIFRIPVNNTFIVAILTIVGYSINNTIVVFDRIRENRKLYRRDQLASLCNDSIQQTLGRSLAASFTTVITVLFLFILGVQSLRWFALPLMVGIIAGTYSSLYIASPIWVLLEKRLRK